MLWWSSQLWNSAITWAFQYCRLRSVSTSELSLYIWAISTYSYFTYCNSRCYISVFWFWSHHKHYFVPFPTAFHYPELNTSHLLRSSWVRTGIIVSLLGMVKSWYCTWDLFVPIFCVLFLLSVYIVLLGVLDQKVNERIFQASMERRVAMLLGEAMGLVRRVRRATTIGNSSVQVQCIYLLLYLDVFTAVSLWIR